MTHQLGGACQIDIDGRLCGLEINGKIASKGMQTVDDSSVCFCFIGSDACSVQCNGAGSDACPAGQGLGLDTLLEGAYGERSILVP